MLNLHPWIGNSPGQLGVNCKELGDVLWLPQGFQFTRVVYLEHRLNLQSSGAALALPAQLHVPACLLGA